MLDTTKLLKPNEDLPDRVMCPLSGLPCTTYITKQDSCSSIAEQVYKEIHNEHIPTDPLGIALKELVAKIVGRCGRG